MCYETHRCDGSLKASCSIRRYDGPSRPGHLVPSGMGDGRWHLMMQEYDFDYSTTYMRHVGTILFCPWCGEELG